MSKTTERSNFPLILERYKSAIDKRLHHFINGSAPLSIYEPIHYVITAGGKRLRPILLLLGVEAVGGNARSALDSACAVELLHNFTLVHDDIMDRSELRRGMPTVHRKWNTDTAILSGDQIVACAYNILARAKTSRLKDIIQIFTNAFVEVCEGQGYDKEFEERNDVAVSDYCMMIGKKTSRMISAACEMGGIIGNGTTKETHALRVYGENLGFAFQIQDDILDIDGNEMKFGKMIGRDVIEGKRTFLLLTAAERVNGSDRKIIELVLRRKCTKPNDIKRVREIYRQWGVLAAARNEVERSTRKAQKALGALQANHAASTLLWLSKRLLERQS